MNPKFKVGDRVRIVKYGGLVWDKEKLNFPIYYTDKDGLNYYDLCPDLVGEVGIVDGVQQTPGYPQYSLWGIRKHAWYNEDQLERTSKRISEL